MESILISLYKDLVQSKERISYFSSSFPVSLFHSPLYLYLIVETFCMANGGKRSSEN